MHGGKIRPFADLYLSRVPIRDEFLAEADESKLITGWVFLLCLKVYFLGVEFGLESNSGTIAGRAASTMLVDYRLPYPTSAPS
jgi:hypothetical protein